MQRSHHGARRLVTARPNLHSGAPRFQQSSRSTAKVPSTRHGQNDNATTSKSVTRQRRKRSQGQHAVSILEQLFPRELGAGRRASSVRTPAREIPIHPLENALGGHDSIPSTQPLLGHTPFQAERKRGRAQLDALVSLREEGERIGVLKIQGGTSSLCDSDFRRLAPSGQHIDGWTVQGSLLEVIPIRSQTTLARTPGYYLIFRNWHSANTYRSHISALHSSANATHTYLYPDPSKPSQTFSHQASSYAAMPPGANLQTQLLPANAAQDTAAVYRLAGWHQLLDGRRSPHEVLLWTAFSRVSPHTLYRTIERDGQHRRMPWSLLEPTPDQLLHARPGTDVKFRACMRELIVPRVEPHFRNLGSSSNAASRRPASNTSSSNSSSHPVRDSSPDRDRDLKIRKEDQLKKFILSFSAEAEARRFVLAWHQRDIAPLLGSAEAVGESYAERGAVVVNAEVLFE